MTKSPNLTSAEREKIAQEKAFEEKLKESASQQAQAAMEADKISQKYQNAYQKTLLIQGKAGKRIPITNFKGSDLFDISGTSVLYKHKNVSNKIPKAGMGTPIQPTSLLTDLLAFATSGYRNDSLSVLTKVFSDLNETLESGTTVVKFKKESTTTSKENSTTEEGVSFNTLLREKMTALANESGLTSGIQGKEYSSDVSRSAKVYPGGLTDRMVDEQWFQNEKNFVNAHLLKQSTPENVTVFMVKLLEFLKEQLNQDIDSKLKKEIEKFISLYSAFEYVNVAIKSMNQLKGRIDNLKSGNDEKGNPLSEQAIKEEYQQIMKEMSEIKQNLETAQPNNHKLKYYNEYSSVIKKCNDWMLNLKNTVDNLTNERSRNSTPTPEKEEAKEIQAMKETQQKNLEENLNSLKDMCVSLNTYQEKNQSEDSKKREIFAAQLGKDVSLYIEFLEKQNDPKEKSRMLDVINDFIDSKMDEYKKMAQQDSLKAGKPNTKEYKEKMKEYKEIANEFIKLKNTARVAIDEHDGMSNKISKEESRLKIEAEVSHTQEESSRPSTPTH